MYSPVAFTGYKGPHIFLSRNIKIKLWNNLNNPVVYILNKLLHFQVNRVYFSFDYCPEKNCNTANIQKLLLWKKRF